MTTSLDRLPWLGLLALLAAAAPLAAGTGLYVALTFALYAQAAAGRALFPL